MLMLMLLLTTDPDLFGLDAPGPALDGVKVTKVLVFVFDRKNWIDF
jgi:hypothetical protein